MNGRDALPADRAAGLIMLAAVLFNPILAVINAHAMPLGPTAVVGAEVLIVGAAHVWALQRFQSAMTVWYVLLAVLMMVAAWRGIAAGVIEPKYIRDVALIPTFVVLGMTMRVRSLRSWMLVLHTIVLLGLFVEIAFPDTFARVFAVKEYYISTRGFTDTEFWNSNSTLFVSATRPDDRFFGFVDLHRASSIFLEPVSLGNYCIIAGAFVLASFRDLGFLERCYWILGLAMSVVASDSRLATGILPILVIAGPIAPWLPFGFAALLPPLALFSVAVASEALLLNSEGDDFLGRLSHSVELLASFGPTELVGGAAGSDAAVDSGIAYLITTQSLAGTLAVWLFLALAADEATRRAAVYKLSMAIYLSLTMLVSYSFLSIKTAAIAWCVLGALQTTRGTRLRDVGCQQGV